MKILRSVSFASCAFALIAHPAIAQQRSVVLAQGYGPTQAMRSVGCDLGRFAEVATLNKLTPEQFRKLPVGTILVLPNDCEKPPADAHMSRALLQADMILHKTRSVPPAERASRAKLKQHEKTVADLQVKIAKLTEENEKFNKKILALETQATAQAQWHTAWGALSPFSAIPPMVLALLILALGYAIGWIITWLFFPRKQGVFPFEESFTERYDGNTVRFTLTSYERDPFANGTFVGYYKCGVPNCKEYRVKKRNVQSHLNMHASINTDAKANQPRTLNLDQDR